MHEPLVHVFERVDVARINGVSDLTLWEQAEMLLSRMKDSSGPISTTNLFTVLLDYPTATQRDRRTVRIEVAHNECEAFANFLGSHTITGIFVVVPHDFNMYQQERSHDN
ncbi:hypothetical protein BURKHO8Y_150002 [Burkholderia sp. 8Y]|uniref:hypothetical protein n=1 Tax=Burkholderia sp. 8Y TaxID=2653133 RepID=UPI0012F11C0C|nr:hypothetical protein [Burkholderia sp. 8Y]VXB67286.1 hypothetical protein BURKHO8Y_150002 [Burkholderia sp. 8Y]